MILFLAALSLTCALAYGLVWTFRPVSALRTVIKTVPVAALAVMALIVQGPSGLPLLLPVALILSALGDAFLAGDPKRWLPLGLASFLVAHILYAVLFWTLGGAASLGETWRAGAIGLTALSGVAMLSWLWRHLGALRPAVAVYVAAIVAMVSTSLLLPVQAWPVMVGALAFMASDAILSGDLFRKAHLAGSERLSIYAVWGLYYGGQAAIAYGLMRL